MLPRDGGNPTLCLAQRMGHPQRESPNRQTASQWDTRAPMPEDDPSIEHEPQLSGRPAEGDPSEDAATRSRRARPLRGSAADEELSRHSVFDEPDVFPGRAAEVIDQDWSCGACGYNLRGLETGHRCPECGHVELYRPPPPGEASFGAWYADRKAAASSRRTWAVIALAMVFGGPWAVVGAMWNWMPTVWGPVVLGPATEEAMKIAAIAWVIEKRPYLFAGAWQIRLAAIGGALGFAIVENVLYLTVYVASPSLGLMLWRWTVCVGLHLGCTSIAVLGLVKVWEEVAREQRAARMTQAMGPLVLAIILHGAYNGLVTLADMIGYGF